MYHETEPGKFRPGESTGKPWGGNVSSAPFPQALYSLARSRGYESQLALANGLCKKESSMVRAWYIGEHAPSPDELGSLLRLLKPNEQELDSLIAPYGQLLQDSELRIRLKNMKPAKTPFEAWIKGFCQERQVTMGAVATLVGATSIKEIANHDISLQTYSEILQNAPTALDLSEQEVISLGDVVAQTIQQRIETGRNFHDYLGGAAVTRAQSGFACITYNGAQAAEILDLSRERIRQLRVKHNLPLLLNDEHIKILRRRKSPTG